MANFCGYCGSPLDPDSRVCGQCGRPVEGKDWLKSFPKQKRGKRIKTVKILLSILVLLVIFVSVYQMFPSLIGKISGGGNVEQFTHQVMKAYLKDDRKKIYEMKSSLYDNYSDTIDMGCFEAFNQQSQSLYKEFGYNAKLEYEISQITPVLEEDQKGLIEIFQDNEGGASPKISEPNIVHVILYTKEGGPMKYKDLYLLLIKESGTWKLVTGITYV